MHTGFVRRRLVAWSAGVLLPLVAFVALHGAAWAAPTETRSTTPVPTAKPLAGSLLDVHFSSPTLGRSVPYRVYLPPGYASASRSYPVLYMLHGAGGDYTEWTVDHLPDAADDLTQRGLIQPMLVVMPDAAGRTFWANWPDNGPHWADYLANDVVREIDSHYRTLSGPANRAVGGLSMGGLGALHSALHHPDIWGVVGGHSPSIRPEPDLRISPMLTGQTFDEFNPSWLLQHRWQAGQRIAMWLDIGVDDGYRGYVENFHQLAVDHGIDVAWHEFPGGHEGAYWSAHAADYLAYYSQAFQLAGAPPTPTPTPTVDPTPAPSASTLGPTPPPTPATDTATSAPAPPVTATPLPTESEDTSPSPSQGSSSVD